MLSQCSITLWSGTLLGLLGVLFSGLFFQVFLRTDSFLTSDFFSFSAWLLYFIHTANVCDFLSLWEIFCYCFLPVVCVMLWVLLCLYLVMELEFICRQQVQFGSCDALVAGIYYFKWNVDGVVGHFPLRCRAFVLLFVYLQFIGNIIMIPPVSSCLITHLYAVSHVISSTGSVLILLISMCCSMSGILNSDVTV